MAPSTITKDTRVPLSVSIGVTVASLSIGGLLWDIRTNVRHLARDHYGMAAAVEVAMRAAAENPGLRVPNPRLPSGPPFHYPRHEK